MSNWPQNYWKLGTCQTSVTLTPNRPRPLGAGCWDPHSAPGCFSLVSSAAWCFSPSLKLSCHTSPMTGFPLLLRGNNWNCWSCNDSEKRCKTKNLTTVNPTQTRHILLYEYVFYLLFYSNRRLFFMKSDGFLMGKSSALASQKYCIMWRCVHTYGSTFSHTKV